MPFFDQAYFMNLSFSISTIIPTSRQIGFFILFLLHGLSQPVQCQDSGTSTSPYQDSIRALINNLDNDADRFLQFTRIFHRLNHKDTSLTKLYLDTLASFEDKVPDDYFAGHFYYQRGRMLKQQRKFTEAFADLKRAIPAFASSKNTLMEARTNHLVGTIHSATQMFDEAFEYTSRAATLYRTIEGEENNLAGALVNMGTSQQRAGNFGPAQAYFREAAIIYRKINNQAKLFHPFLNLGMTHGRMEQLDSAIFYYNKALEVVDIQGGRKEFLKAYVHNNLSATYKLQEKLDLALITGKKAYDVFKAMGRGRETAAIAGNLGDILTDQGRYAEGIPLLQEGLSVVGPDISIRRTLHEMMVEAFRGTGQLDSMDFHLKRYISLTNDLSDQRRETAISESEGKYQNQLKQAEIARLQAEEALNEARIRRQWWIIGGSLVLLTLISTLLYRVFAQGKEISEQRNALSNSLEEKETLLKEIHHRVKNNLQMVSSLLSLQSRYVTDDTAIAALKMGNSRVRSMALIHQKLYMKDTVSTQIQAGEYLHQLFEELVANLTHKTLELRTETDIEDIDLDIDTLIPLGLITNELITNSLKYAFPDGEKGTLRLTLKKTAGSILLRLQDDGIGTDINPAEDPESFGYLLINSLCDQLNGQLIVDGQNGMLTELRIPEKLHQPI